MKTQERVHRTLREEAAAVTVVLADDHVVVRQGLRTLVESDPQFVVVGEASNGIEAVEVVKRFKPKVLITDLIMPKMNGLETIRKVSNLKLDTNMVILSMYANEAYVLEALRIGAAGYVVKESSGIELLQAIRIAVSGGRYLSPSLSQALHGSYSLMGTILQTLPTDPPNAYETLTSRERTVLQLITEGATSRDIGTRLMINFRTVESHRASLVRKLGVNTDKHLARYALKRGIVPIQKYGRLATSDGHAPVVALFNASDDTVDMVNRMLAPTDIKCLVCHFADLKNGNVDFIRYLATHNPAVVIFDISPPYRENWRFFKTMRDSKAMQGRARVLTTTNKARLDEVARMDSAAIEIVGKSYDLDLITRAIEKALRNAASN